MAGPPLEENVVYTVGHSTRPIDELLAILRAAGVERVVDVRTVPRSRHNPQYDRSTLPGELAAAGLRYDHAANLGGLRKPARDSVNLGWRNAAFRGYADYMQTPTFERAVGDLILSSRGSVTAILCAEAVPWRCHRSLIADALTVHGVRVLHLLGAGPPRPHTLTPFARVDGFRVRYPLPPPSSHPLEAFGGGTTGPVDAPAANRRSASRPSRRARPGAPERPEPSEGDRPG